MLEGLLKKVSKLSKVPSRGGEDEDMYVDWEDTTAWALSREPDMNVFVGVGTRRDRIEGELKNRLDWASVWGCRLSIDANNL